jgi:hypothetical protein
MANEGSSPGGKATESVKLRLRMYGAVTPFRRKNSWRPWEQLYYFYLKAIRKKCLEE